MHFVGHSWFSIAQKKFHRNRLSLSRKKFLKKRLLKNAPLERKIDISKTTHRLEKLISACYRATSVLYYRKKISSKTAFPFEKKRFEKTSKNMVILKIYYNENLKPADFEIYIKIFFICYSLILKKNRIENGHC